MTQVTSYGKRWLQWNQIFGLFLAVLLGYSGSALRRIYRWEAERLLITQDGTPVRGSHLSHSSSYLPDTLPWRVVQAMTSLMGARVEMFYLERVAPPRGLTVLLTAMVVATARILSSHARVMAALI